MNQTLPVTAQVRLKHGLLYELSKQFGSVRKLAAHLGIGYTVLNSIVNFGFIPSRKTLVSNPRWLTAEERLLVLCGKGWADIFPDELRSAEFIAKPKRFEITREVPIASLSGSEQALLMPAQDDEIARTELAESLGEALLSLTPREQQVIRLRFGLDGNREHTLAEVAEIFCVTGERVRQAEAKALRKLRRPSISRTLKSFLESSVYYPVPITPCGGGEAEAT